MDGLTVELLPAGPGDGLWIEWGPSDTERHRMVIDGGTKKYAPNLRARLEQLADDGGIVDLLVITHIDVDHIDAAVDILANPVTGVEFNDVWFNDYHHLVPKKRGARSGEHLDMLLDLRDQASNQAAPFNGGPVVVPDSEDGNLPIVKLAGGLVLYLVSPTATKLEKLEKVWKKWSESDKGWAPGNHTAARKNLGKRVIELEEEDDPDVGGSRSKGPPKWGKDGSEANGSSIAFIAEYGDQRWLLSGDAHADVLVDGLRRFAKQRKIEGKVPLTGFKVPHHGSVRNVTDELLDLIDCNHYLISTNGSGNHNHPNEECIDLLVEKAGSGVHLEFNYHTEHTLKWATVDGVTTTYRYNLDGEPYVDDGADQGRGGPDESNEPADSRPAPVPTVATKGIHIDVAVRHGTLERYSPTTRDYEGLMVGHYEGSTIEGAERALDQWMNGQLARRELLGVYPGPIGSADVIETPDGRDAVVVGMGEIGTLTTTGLTNSVAEGVLRLALKSYAAGGETVPGAEPMGIKISSTLIGTTGANKLTIDNSVRAIVRGVVAANRSLLENELLDSVRVDSIEFIEAFEEIAIAATHAVGLLDTEIGGGLTGTINPKPRMLTSHDSGGLPGQPRLDYNTGEWRPLHVQALDDHLNFKSVGLLARAEESIHPGQRDLIEKLVRDTIDDPRAESQTYNTLYELLIPNYLKGLVAEGDNLMLVLDDKATEFPWEMLLPQSPTDGAGREDKRVEPVSVRTGMLRRLVTPTFRAGARRAGGNAALVIGDPPAGDEWDRLPGAQVEATTVRDLLGREGFKVTDEIFDGDGSASVDIELRVLNSLFQDEYRIVHIAGHGEYNDQADASGVVIGETARITPLVLRQLQAIPQLVFLNCCHLGQMDVDDAQPSQPSTPLAGHFHRFAASVATQLIRDGVRAVVAAGWAVDDKPAVVFAEKFYEAMFEGSPFGEAVHRARKAVWNDPAFERSNTWGAYQCYGDPGFKLVQKRDSPDRQADSTGPPVARRPVARKELLDELQQLRQEVEAAVERRLSERETEDTRTRVVLRLDQLQQEFGSESSTEDAQRWDDGEVLYHQADVYAALEDWQKALQLYERSLRRGGSQGNPVKLEVLMKIARCMFLLAINRWWDLDWHPDTEVIEGVQQAEMRLRQLIDLAPTPDNVLALADLHRQSLGIPDGRQREHLDLAAKSYVQATEDFEQLGEPVGWPHRWSILFRTLRGDPLNDIETRIGHFAEKEKQQADHRLFDWELLRGIARQDLERRLPDLLNRREEYVFDEFDMYFVAALKEVLANLDDQHEQGRVVSEMLSRYERWRLGLTGDGDKTDVGRAE